MSEMLAQPPPLCARLLCMNLRFLGQTYRRYIETGFLPAISYSVHERDTKSTPIPTLHERFLIYGVPQHHSK